MNAKEANKISIVTYLDQLGIKPSKVKAGYCFYLSPYREEKTPSFKVHPIKNLWVDFGDGNAGGTLIDLVLKMNPNFTISEAIQEIATISGSSFFFTRQFFPMRSLPKRNHLGLPSLKPILLETIVPLRITCNPGAYHWRQQATSAGRYITAFGTKGISGWATQMKMAGPYGTNTGRAAPLRGFALPEQCSRPLPVRGHIRPYELCGNEEGGAIPNGFYGA